MSKIAKLLSQKLVGYGWPGNLRYSETWDGPGKFVHLEDEIDRALEGKIISKSEVDALRRDKYFTDCKYQSIVAELAGARSENLKLKQENVNLKVDIANLKVFPLVHYAVDWGFVKDAAFATGQIISVEPCDICQKLDPPNSTHGHSDFEKFVRRLKFWR